MSKINAAFNINSNEWALEATEPNAFHIDLNIIFTSDTEFITFDALSFGFVVIKNGIPVFEKFYPTYGVNYAGATNGSVFEKAGWECAPEDEYVINLWIENAGTRTETSYTFSSPRPIQPYLSWSWNTETKTWNPPIPQPEGTLKQWNEELGNWEEISAEISSIVPDPLPTTVTT